MQRKVSRIGPSTLMVSLPSEWCKKFQIKKGDDLNIGIEDDKLLISKKEIYINRGIYELKISTEDPEVFKMLVLAPLLLAPYMKGYSTIKVSFESDAVLNYIRKAVTQFLLGFEIIEQGKKHCIIKNIARGIEEEFSIIFHRVFRQTVNMGKTISEAIKKKDFTLLERIEAEESFTDKLNYFCRRMLHVQHPAQSQNISHIYRIICIIEEIGDCYKYMAFHLIKYKRIPSAKLVIYLDDANKFVELTHQWLQKFDEEKYFKERPRYTFFYSQDIYPTIPQEDSALLGYLIMIVHRLIHITDEELTKEPLF